MGVTLLFKVGDKVVYPMHGAGIIEAIEEKEILGETRSYYVMRMPIGDITVMIPFNSVKDSGLRDVIEEEHFNEVMHVLREHEKNVYANWNHRYRANLEKMKSGDIFAVAYVVRSLMDRDEDKALSTGERKMLENAKQILISELILSKGISQEEALSFLDDIRQE